MDYKTDADKPAEIPYKWAKPYIKAMQAGSGLSGQEHTKADGHVLVSGGPRKHDAKAEDKDKKSEAEDFINQHVMGMSFPKPHRSGFASYQGGRRYYGRDDSLYRWRKSREEESK